MPKRSKIVSGKVIAAVAKSKAKKVEEAEVAVTEAPVAEPVLAVKEIDYSVDLKTRFKQRKSELNEGRHADSEENQRRLKKRREKEAKKQQRAKQQKRPIDGTSKDLEIGREAKKAKSVEKSGGLEVEEGNFQFSRLDERDLSKPNTEPAKKKALDPKSALQKLEAEKAKMQKLKESNPEKAAAVEAKLQAKKALQKAQGFAVKDNEALLKKSIARREKEKEKSRQVWEKKKNDLKTTQDERQTKRDENIQARIDAKKSKKKGQKSSHKGKFQGKSIGKSQGKPSGKPKGKPSGKPRK